MRRQTRKTSMPPQRGVDRFYYPLKERSTDMAGTNRQINADVNDRPNDKISDAVKGSINVGLFESGFDPNGSYTGTPTDGGVPTQDADDL